MKRGIPPVEDYAHWNEEAEQVWYLENKYDMEHPEVFDDYDPYDREPDPICELCGTDWDYYTDDYDEWNSDTKCHRSCERGLTGMVSL